MNNKVINGKKLNQYSFIKDYNDKYRENFNNDLLYRSDDDIIECIKKVILSCQRSKYFTIRVDKFTVVDDYAEIGKLLKEQERFKSKSKNKDEKNNKYNYITLKDSEIKLLIVDYYLWVPNPPKDMPNSKTLRVIIEIPKIIDKYYFKIFGNIYSSMYQIVDGSTYNNSQSVNSKSQNVTLKTMFMASRVYRYQEMIRITEGISIRCVYYSSRIFNKSVPLMKYLFARFGFEGLKEKLMVPYLTLSSDDPKRDDWYTAKKNNIFVSLPKYIYDNDITAQSMFYTTLLSINKESEAEDMTYNDEYWAKSLGESFNNKTPEKGYAILDSLESIYDILTKESIRLPQDQKEDIYDILIWVIREFTELRQKDNLDISTKRIRYAEYIAALYAMKLSKGLYRISDEGTNIQLSSIEKAIYTFPDDLLKMITKDSLVNYKNSVNDLDAIQALKFTYKGVSGIGEAKGASIPTSYRQVHMSHIGRVDLDSSSASDPGLSGIICPLSDMYDKSFSDYSEPNNWREETEKLLSDYRDLVGLDQSIDFKESIGIKQDPVKKEIVKESIEILEKLIQPVAYLDSQNPMIILPPIVYL